MTAPESMNEVAPAAMPIVSMGLSLMYAVLAVRRLALLPASFGECAPSGTRVRRSWG